MMCEVLNGIGLTDFTIKINHRGVLRNIYQALGGEGRESDLFVAIDKLDKIGREGVEKELAERGFSAQASERLFELLATAGSFGEKLQKLEGAFQQAGVAADRVLVSERPGLQRPRRFAQRTGLLK